MFIEPILKVFWILIVGIILTNCAWMLYVGGLEDKISSLYKLIKLQRLNKFDKKKLNKTARRCQKNDRNRE